MQIKIRRNGTRPWVAYIVGPNDEFGWTRIFQKRIRSVVHGTGFTSFLTPDRGRRRSSAMAEWGRKEYKKPWPSRCPVWTWTAFFLSGVFFFGVFCLDYWHGWTAAPTENQT
jgi:hypothetical protein